MKSASRIFRWILFFQSRANGVQLSLSFLNCHTTFQPGNAAQADEWMAMGFNVISWGSDVAVYRAALNSAVAALREKHGGGADIPYRRVDFRPRSAFGRDAGKRK